MIKTISDADAYFDSHFIASVAASLKRNFRLNVLYKLTFYDRRDAYKETTRTDTDDISFFNFSRMLSALYCTGHFSGYMSAMMSRSARVSAPQSVPFNWSDAVTAVAGNIYNS